MVIKWSLIVIKCKKMTREAQLTINDSEAKCHNGTCLHNRFISFQYQLKKYTIVY